MPCAVLVLPVVKRLSCRFCEPKSRSLSFCRRLPGQKEINVVEFFRRRIHIHTSKVFASAEVLQPIIVHLGEFESKILALILDVEFGIRALLTLRIDVFLDAS